VADQPAAVGVVYVAVVLSVVGEGGQVFFGVSGEALPLWACRPGGGVASGVVAVGVGPASAGAGADDRLHGMRMCRPGRRVGVGLDAVAASRVLGLQR
jgi:hypothetical protein